MPVYGKSRTYISLSWTLWWCSKFMELAWFLIKLHLHSIHRIIHDGLSLSTQNRKPCLQLSPMGSRHLLFKHLNWIFKHFKYFYQNLLFFDIFLINFSIFNRAISIFIPFPHLRIQIFPIALEICVILSPNWHFIFVSCALLFSTSPCSGTVAMWLSINALSCFIQTLSFA